MNQKIEISELGKAIQSIVDEYSDEAQKVVEETLPKVGKDAVKELKKKSPKKTGKYAKGWKSKIESDRLGSKVVVYNKTSYQLTHLLEKGHANRGGGRTEGIPHIKPTEDKVVEEALNMIEERLKE